MKRMFNPTRRTGDEVGCGPTRASSFDGVRFGEVALRLAAALRWTSEGEMKVERSDALETSVVDSPDRGVQKSGRVLLSRVASAVLSERDIEQTAPLREEGRKEDPASGQLAHPASEAAPPGTLHAEEEPGVISNTRSARP